MQVVFLIIQGAISFFDSWCNRFLIYRNEFACQPVDQHPQLACRVIAMSWPASLLIRMPNQTVELLQ
jgi:hypothetical protein